MSPTNGEELAAWAPDISEAERGASMNQSPRDTSGVFPIKKPNVFFGENEKAVGDSGSNVTIAPKKVLAANCKKNQAVKHESRNPVIIIENRPNSLKAVKPLVGRDSRPHLNSDNVLNKGKFVQQSVLVMKSPTKSQKKADEKSYLRHRILSLAGAGSIESIPRSDNTSATKKVAASQDFLRNRRDSQHTFSSGIKSATEKPVQVANPEAITHHRLAKREKKKLGSQDQPMKSLANIGS